MSSAPSSLVTDTPTEAPHESEGGPARRHAALGAPDFRAIFEASPDRTLVLAPDAPEFTILAASNEYLAATMTTREATVGRPMFAVFSDDNPANAERSGVANLRASLEAVLRTRAPHRMPVQRYDIQRPDGAWDERCWEPLNAPVLAAGGDVLAIVHRVEDVTARARAEADVRDAHERLVAALAASETGIFRWDVQSDALEWDESLSRLLGLAASQPTRTLAEFLALVHPDDRAAVRAARDRAVRDGADISIEFRVVGASGHLAWLAARGRTYADEGGRPRYITGACVEITERKAAEAALRGAKEAAEVASRTRSEFLATMSHEFRTPLNAILGYAQLLDMGVLGPTTPAQHAHLERLQASGRHLLQLVDDVLDVAKVDADRLAVRRDRLATGAAVASALALVQPQATAKGIRVEDFGVPGPGVPYVGDEHRVRQILVNLLANAVKFTEPGGVVTVSCGTAPEPDPGVLPGGAGASRPAPGHGWAFIRVQDTGPGIAPELFGRLFEAFVQGDGALTRAHGGTGLGLAISRRLARLMGGDLVVENRPGRDALRSGATFTLWLPAPDATSVEAGAGTSRPERRTPASVAAVLAQPSGSNATLPPSAYPVLHALGVRLGADAETVAERYVAALRDDTRFPGAATLPSVQLRDHTTPVVGLVAAQIMIIGETRGAAPELLGDGGQVQRVMAELHGAQRYRLGWSEADVERETPLLLAEIERALDGALGHVGEGIAAGALAIADAVADAGAATRAPFDDPAVVAASRYARDVVRHVLDQVTRTALRSHRFARAAATP